MDFRTDKLLHGGDYNPEQWLKRPDILEKDIDMLEESGCNVVSLGIFSWSTLEPEEGVFHFGWLQEIIDKDRRELAGNFCRSCGYCLPCTAGIDIPQAARMSQLLGRSPYRPYMSDTWYAKMHKIEECVHCDICKSRCPYGLDTPALLERQLAEYDAFYAIHHND